jgi:hypothetical protein
MSGEATFNRNMYEVVQEIIRQLLVNDSEPFEYKTTYGLRSSVVNVSREEQLKLLSILNDKGVIRLNHYRVHNPGTEVMMETQLGDEAEIEAMMSQVYEITASKAELDQYAASLSVPGKEQETIAGIQMITCTLRLHDRDMMLKIGEYPEKQIGRLQEDRPLHKLMIALSSRSPGVDVRSADVLPNADNLWQLFGKSNFSYLAPFFKHTNRRIAFYPTVELSKNQVISLISKVTEKYRKNLDSITDNL